MSNARLGETSDRFDFVTGRWLGVLDGNGNEVDVPTFATDPLTGVVVGFSLPGGGSVGLGDVRPRASAAYLGQAATGCVSLHTNNAANKQSMWRTRHIIRDNVSFLQVAYPNWYHDAAAGNNFQETAPAGDMTVKGAIEYNGVLYPLTWSGTSTTTAPAGGTSPLSDQIAVQMSAGDAFYIRSYTNSPAGGMVYTENSLGGGLDVVNGECNAFGVTTPDLTASTGVFTTSGTAVKYTPCLIVSNITIPSVYLLGDSRSVGVSDTHIGTSGDTGYARFIGPYFGYYKAAKSGDAANKFVNGTHTQRVSYASYFSHILIGYGFNDVNAYTRTPAQTAADLTTMAGYFTGKKVLGCTFSPNTTATTDSYATVVNQTSGVEATDLTALQALVRAGISGFNGFFDLASVSESGLGSQKWYANGVANFPTTDGKHETQQLLLWMKQMNVVTPEAFKF